MRTVIVAVVLAALLGLIGSLTVRVAGDVGPGENGAAPALRLAGDVGPGEN